MLDKRAQILLKTLIERYIAEGQPIGSRTLSRHAGLDLSPATIRNVMSDLEEMGLIASPHTSAGRVPTPLGYRFFVDSLLVVKEIGSGDLHQLEDQLHPDNPQRVIQSASQLLSQLTNFAGVVMTPRRRSLTFRQIEFLRLSEKRVLLIVVTPDGDVLNRILFTDREYSPAELVSAANYINQNYSGHSFEDIRQRVTSGDLSALLETRAPSLLAMALSRALRDEGKDEEARALAEKVRADLDASGELKRFLLVEAEIEMTVGSTWMDSNDPSRAEVELVRAVERLEAIEKALVERGASPGDLGIVRGMRASALVSLAVNANVKMKDTKKAIAYFERAYELRQDEFMRVLLACYRARDGRGEEARAILREISPSPANLYNVACTWALLGEKDLALDCLKRDLEENPMTPGAREKQKEWARQDPDLESVRDDARFRAIVGAPAGK